MKVDINDIVGSWFDNAPSIEKVNFIKRLLQKLVDVEKPISKRVEENKIRKHVDITILGKTFSSMKSAADYFDIAYHKVQYRKDRGQTIEQIFREAYLQAKREPKIKRNAERSV